MNHSTDEENIKIQTAYGLSYEKDMITESSKVFAAVRVCGLTLDRERQLKYKKPTRIPDIRQDKNPLDSHIVSGFTINMSSNRCRKKRL